MTGRGFPLALAVIAAVASLARVPALAGEPGARVVTVAGQAEAQKAGASAWSPAVLRAEIGPGDAARVLRGRLTLLTASGQALRLASMSRLDLVADGAADRPTRVRLLGGLLWAAVLPASPPSEQFEVLVGPAATCVVKAGGVELVVGRDGSALVRVYHGAAECAGPGAERRWTRALKEGQQMLVAASGSPAETKRLVPDKADADWIKWNEDQDRAGNYGVRSAPR